LLITFRKAGSIFEAKLYSTIANIPISTGLRPPILSINESTPSTVSAKKSVNLIKNLSSIKS
jgi:hypothetical protein